MKGIKTSFLILLLIFFSSGLKADYVDITSVIDNIFNFNFKLAKLQLQQSAVLSDNKVNEALDLEMRWWMALETNAENRFSDFLISLDRFEKSNKDDLSKIISSTYRMRYYACNNKKYKIPFLFLSVRKDIENVDADYLKVSNNEEYKLFILYKSFLTLVQENYGINKVFASSEKNNELIGSVEELIKNSPDYRTLGRYFLMKYYMDVEKNRSKALDYLVVLHNQYPNNKIFSQLLTN